MIIKLLPQQIPQLWEAIKLAAVQSDEIPIDVIAPYLHRLLQGLLSDRVQCFVRLDEARTLLSLVITSILVNQLTGQRELVVRCFYSFRTLSEEDARASMNLLKNFATAQQCDRLSCDSRHPRVWQLVSDHGWREESRHYTYAMNGGG